ncbi:MAG: hypothetical protein JSV78_11215 [Phycisphaerales bacterium]|nr:MAG: hypothetical protein JSV78_11215 [Phycisphaerales bacterium]
MNPFEGSGTTADAARKAGRWGITPDKRPCQAEIAGRRLAEGVLSFD